MDSNVYGLQTLLSQFDSKIYGLKSLWIPNLLDSKAFKFEES